MAYVSKCKYCGEPIVWVKHQRWVPYVPGTEKSELPVRHECRQEKSALYQKRKESARPFTSRLSGAAREAFVRNLKASRLGEYHGPDLPRGKPASDAGMDYYPFQKIGIAGIVDRLEQGWGGVLLADDPGLGKTVQAIGTINLIPDVQNVLVVCPNTVKYVWKDHLEVWLDRPMTVGVGGADRLPDEQVAIVNYDSLHKWEDELAAREWDLLILDEVHMAKNPKARRSVAVYSVEAKRKLFMSGSPIVNRPSELWAPIHALCPTIWTNRSHFDKRYCGADPSNNWDRSGATHLGELHDILRGTVMIRRLKSEVLRELPPKVRQVVMLDAEQVPGSREVIMREKQVLGMSRAAMEELEEAMRGAKSEEEYRDAVKALNEERMDMLAALARVRHDTARVKLPAVIDHLKGAVEESGKVVVFAHHLDIVQALAEPFGSYAVVLVGDTPERERRDVVKRFQEDPGVRVIVAGVTVGGLGITLTAASRCVFAELDFRPAVVTQCEDRLHRIGQMDSVLVQHVLLEGSIDARMAKVLLRKQAVIDKALDRKESSTVDEPDAPQVSPTEARIKSTLSSIAKVKSALRGGV